MPGECIYSQPKKKEDRRQISATSSTGIRREKGNITDSGHDSTNHHLHPLDTTPHQHRTEDHRHTAGHQTPLPAQLLGREGRCNGPKNGAYVVQRGNGTDHNGRRVAHFGEPILRNDHPGHDTLIIPKQQESRGADRGDGAQEDIPAEPGDSCEARHVWYYVACTMASDVEI
jgi:hypothetical protein